MKKKTQARYGYYPYPPRNFKLKHPLFRPKRDVMTFEVFADKAVMSVPINFRGMPAARLKQKLQPIAALAGQFMHADVKLIDRRSAKDRKPVKLTRVFFPCPPHGFPPGAPVMTGPKRKKS